MLDNKRWPIKKNPSKPVSAQEAELSTISQVRLQCEKIDSNWLLVHYNISLGLVLASLILELGIGLFMISSGFLTITTERYVLKYIAVPGCTNLTLIAIATVVLHAKRLTQSAKIYTVSLIFPAICFTLATVHSIFPATYYLFTVAVALTTIYASYRLTCAVGFLSITAIISSELLFRWDPDKVSIFSSTEHLINFLITLFILAASSLVSLVQIRYEMDKNEAGIQKELERQQLHRRLRTDELTGVLSRKALQDMLRELDANPSQHGYILAITDLDKFKGVNDCLGHHTGDSYLVAFADILKGNIAGAEVYRYGGDEFCLLFHNIPMYTAVEACRQLRQKLVALTFKEYPAPKLTASFGLAAYTGGITTARLFINADKAMYKAKGQENGICVFASPGQYDALDDV